MFQVLSGLVTLGVPVKFRVPALEDLGFLLTTFIFMAFCWLAVDRQPFLRGLLISAAVSGASFLLFAKVLNVHFPRGLLGF